MVAVKVKELPAQISLVVEGAMVTVGWGIMSLVCTLNVTVSCNPLESSTIIITGVVELLVRGVPAWGSWCAGVLMLQLSTIAG